MSNKFGSKYAQRLRRKHSGYGDAFYIDEVFLKIQGERHYLWRAVDQDGVAHRELIPETIHDTTKYAKNRCKLSHEPKYPITVTYHRASLNFVR